VNSLSQVTGSSFLAVHVTGDRISSPQVTQRRLGDGGACDVKENSSPKVEQLVISPFDEGIDVI